MSGDTARGLISDLRPGTPVLVAGGGVTGRSVLTALVPLGVTATLCDDDPATRQQFADAGTATVDSSTAARHITDYALVVTSPGFPPTAPVPTAAASSGVPVWGDVELAWRLDVSGHYGPPRRWLAVTGTNGKTTTTSMLQAMLTSAGLRSRLCGNIGSPVLDVLREPADLLAIELSSFQLHWAPSMRPEAGVVLNIAEDHLDWHGTLADYTADKARVLTGRLAVAGLDDPRAAALLSTTHAPLRVGFRLGEPAAGELGVRDGMLVDRAFADDLVLAAVSSIPVPGPVGVLDALAAAALARSVRGARRSGRRRAGDVSGGPAPRRAGRRRRPDQLRRRLQSHQPARRRGIGVGIPEGGVDSRGSAQGCVGAGDGGPNRSAAGRSGADRPRPGSGCRRVITTRAGCPRRTRCDRRGC
jgi:UDP-N-acetylmuramoylalanine--D-glutamate ligase